MRTSHSNIELFVLSFLVWVLFPLSLSASSNIFSTPNKTYKISRTINLKGETIQIAEGCTLDFQGGIISNGVLVGKGTKINCGQQPIFDNIQIKGSWTVPTIRSTMFLKYDKDNTVCELFNLCSDQLLNEVIIGAGLYWVSVNKERQNAIDIKNNTNVLLNGTIRLRSNDLSTYSIINLHRKENILISGSGKIIGDRADHIGTDGEWGMGIFSIGSSKITITGITINNCWGDCIYLGGNTHDVKISDVQLDRGRRQGISITSGSDISISNSKISFIEGTEPQYAIDIEPNKKESVDRITISNIEASNCAGGVMAYGKAEGASIGTISVTNCTISSKTKYVLALLACKDVLVRSNILKSGASNYAVYCEDVGKLKLTNNQIYTPKSHVKTLKCKAKTIKNNKLYK